ncbi:predicted protein [Histoplasma capsulatum var. duboisii H88]|uniref:Predicted protein n=1 Tax=Ajellomyces capsulatus (strain H88) TaxID=544711 RepID=F0USR2_AJEC8|nr:predicted protein [Histoplasma capsulatum var. duboisii H88]
MFQQHHLSRTMMQITAKVLSLRLLLRSLEERPESKHRQASRTHKPISFPPLSRHYLRKEEQHVVFLAVKTSEAYSSDWKERQLSLDEPPAKSSIDNALSVGPLYSSLRFRNFLQWAIIVLPCLRSGGFHVLKSGSATALSQLTSLMQTRVDLICQARLKHDDSAI